MNEGWTLIRSAVLAFVVAGTIGYGARSAQGHTDLAAPGGACNQAVCKAECGVFGGHLGPGGPGEPLECRCCG